MFGCIKTILKIAIVVLAIIGFKSIGGVEFVQEKWAQYLKLTCYENGVAFFMKQMSHNKEIPNYLNIRQFPKKYD